MCDFSTSSPNAVTWWTRADGSRVHVGDMSKAHAKNIVLYLTERGRLNQTKHAHIIKKANTFPWWQEPYRLFTAWYYAPKRLIARRLKRLTSCG